MIRIPVLSDSAWPTLGQAVAPAQESALVELGKSATRALAELNYLANARAADWEARVDDALRLIPSEFKYLDIIRGKTGNPDAERRVSLLWGDVHKAVITMMGNKPSVASQILDRGSLFLTDFWAGVKQGQEDFARWAITATPAVLQDYYDALKRMRVLQKDLADAKASGSFSQAEIAAKENEVGNGLFYLNKVNGIFKTISGGLSLDQVAQDEYGPLGNPALPLLAAVAIGVAATAILAAAGYVLKIAPLTKKAQDTLEESEKTLKMLKIAIPVVVGLGAVAVLFYVFSTIRNKKS